MLSLQLVRRQHAMLRASNALAPSLQETYDALVKLAEGDKGVAWADQSVQSLHDLSMAESQQALFESFLVHASPRARSVNPCGTNSPSIAASLGILTSTTTSSQVTVSSSNTSANTVARDSKPLSAKIDAPIAPSPLSHSVQSRWQPKGTPVRIPNKPRKPTPDDSSSSNGSTYHTRLNAVLNADNTKSSPAMSNLKRSKSDSSSGSSGQKDAQPYTLPIARWQSNAKQGRVLQQGISSPMGGSLPHLARPTQSVGANSVDFAPNSKLHPGNFSTTPILQQRSATAFNAFEDNFVSPRVAFNSSVSSQTKDSSSWQNLPDHALQSTQAVSFPTALLCKPISSPAPTFSSSHTSISNQPQREKSGFVPISHAGTSYFRPVVSNPRPVLPHVPLGIGKAKYEDSSSTSQNSKSNHMGFHSVAVTPTSIQGSSAFNPVPQRMNMSLTGHNLGQLNHSHYHDVVLSQVQRKSHDSRREDSAEQRRRLSAELTTSTAFHDPRGRGLAETHHRKQYAVEALPSPRRCSADASWLTKQHTVEAVPSPRRCSADPSSQTMQQTVQTMPSPRRCSADTSHDQRRQYSAEVIPNTSMCSPSRRMSADIVYELRRQQATDQNAALCSSKGKESADVLYTHRKRHPTEIGPRSQSFNPDRRSLESELNLTYTIDSDKDSVQSAPGVTTISKHPTSMFNVASTNPLAPLRVNSPKPLEERHRTMFTGKC